MHTLSRLVRALFEFIFPKSAAVLALEDMSAGDLVKALPSAEPIEDEHTIAVFSYAHPVVRELVWELKYRGNRTVAEKLAHVLMDVLSHELAERGAYENFTHPLLIPMPIADKRKNERGYNQTEILAEEMKRLDASRLFTLVERQLVKHRHTSSQTVAATREERLENIKGTMHVVHPPRVAGACIILLDDVTTTGATFAEAKRALKEAGARKILCLAVAH